MENLTVRDTVLSQQADESTRKMKDRLVQCCTTNKVTGYEVLK